MSESLITAKLQTGERFAKEIPSQIAMGVGSVYSTRDHFKLQLRQIAEIHK